MKADPIPHCPPDKLIFITKDKADTTSSVKASGILLSFLHSSSVLEGHAVPTSVATCHNAVVVCMCACASGLLEKLWEKLAQ